MKLILSTILGLLLSSVGFADYESSNDPLLAETGNEIQVGGMRYNEDTPLGRFCDKCETIQLKGGPLTKSNPAAAAPGNSKSKSGADGM